MARVLVRALVNEFTHDHPAKLATLSDLAVEMSDMELVTHLLNELCMSDFKGFET